MAYQQLNINTIIDYLKTIDEMKNIFSSFDDLEKITKAIVINQDESDSLPTFSNEKKSLFETTDKTIINVP